MFSDKPNPAESRAKADTGKVVGLIVGVVVATLIIAFLGPIGIEALNTGSTTTVEHTDTTTEYDLEGGDLTAVLDSATDGTEATVTVSSETDTDTATIAQGETETLTVDGSDVTATVDTAGTDTATVTYHVSQSYGWSGGAAAMWGILDIIVVLAFFLAIIGMALKGANKI